MLKLKYLLVACLLSTTACQTIDVQPVDKTAALKNCLEDAYLSPEGWIVPSACKSKTQRIKDQALSGKTRKLNGTIYLNSEGVANIMLNP